MRRQDIPKCPTTNCWYFSLCIHGKGEAAPNACRYDWSKHVPETPAPEAATADSVDILCNWIAGECDYCPIDCRSFPLKGGRAECEKAIRAWAERKAKEARDA